MSDNHRAGAQSENAGARPLTAETAGDFKKGDYVLMCSDGLTNMAEPEEIAAIVALEESADSDSLKEAAERLIQLANDRGGADNITAVILAY